MSFSVTSKKLLIFLRDLAFIALAVYAISIWQSRNMLDSDGSTTVPNPKLVSLAGDTETIFAPQKTTLVYFFAPWCTICAASIGNLEELEGPNLRIVRVALDYQSVNEVERFVLNNEVKGTVLLGRDEIKQQFQVPGYPAYYLVNENLQVVGSSYGYSTSLGLKLKHYLAE